MGLSSSQGRLLMLTSRLSDIQLQMTMISQQQNILAWESEQAAIEYNEAISNQKIQIKVTDENEKSGSRTEDINYDNITQMGYLVTNADSQIYLEKDKDGNWVIPKDLDGNDLLSIGEDGKATIAGIEDQKFDILDGGKYISNRTILQNAIMNGMLYLIDTKDKTTGISAALLESETDFSITYDTSDDAKAQAKYDCETARLSRAENQLDMQLNQLETQHEAILKEYDSVKKVISNNTERTFNLFSDG